MCVPVRAPFSEIPDRLSSLGARLVFRGQHEDFREIRASAFRPGKAAITSEAFYQHAVGSIIPCLESFLGVSWRDILEDEKLTQATLQHYDYISAGVDVTFDWKIACWFATYRFEPAPGAEMEFSGIRYRTNLMSITQRTDEIGFLYAFRVEDLEPVGLFDLAPIFRNRVGLNRIRPVQQMAGLAGLASRGTDLQSRAAAIYIFKVREALSSVPKIASMYPPPSEDPVLWCLLNQSFYVYDDTGGRRPFRLCRLVEPIEQVGDFAYTETMLQTLLGPPQGRICKSSLLLHEPR
jgi:hypothetical protein